MLNKILVVTESQNAPLIIPEGVIKLLWYVSNPLPQLPTTLKILIAPYVGMVREVPDGLVFLEVTGNTLVNHVNIPKTCHVEIIDYGCLQNLNMGELSGTTKGEIGRVNVDDLAQLLKMGTKSPKPSWLRRKINFWKDLFLYPKSKYRIKSHFKTAVKD